MPSLTPKAFILTATITLAACVNPNPNTVETFTKPVRSQVVFEQAKSLVAERMRDPEATRFKSDYTSFQTNTGDYIVCGTVNAKYAMGGYVGYKSFYIRFSGDNIKGINVPSEGEYAAAEATQVAQDCANAAIGKIMTTG